MMYQDLTHRSEINAVYQELRDLPKQVESARNKLFLAGRDEREVRFELAHEEEMLKRLEIAATAEAYASGVVDGKNQAQRDLQVSTYLANHKDYKAMERSLENKRWTLAEKQNDVEEAKTTLDTLMTTLRTLAYAVDLQVAVLNFEPLPCEMVKEEE